MSLTYKYSCINKFNLLQPELGKKCKRNTLQSLGNDYFFYVTIINNGHYSNMEIHLIFFTNGEILQLFLKIFY